ncbi:hypothetical protein MAPG_08166 [Magnaporthiopsis poae ATCC 64411]|uniref:Uncharacterized protein n=1 Tax=Magnaporthiopsis poae (strain ATCC 64411 / 73-15) TaxID=644358 RepID=A0A0C4E6M3_MAGP6|nr:hypothetical protein MAPG_08166 [Magnaporthiopsis poae ATCC 64411]
MSSPTRHRRSPTPYPSRSRDRHSHRRTNASWLLSRLMDNALHRCGLAHPEQGHKDQEKAQSRRPSTGSVQPLREKPSHGDMAMGHESPTTDSHGHVTEGRFHRLFTSLVSPITGLTCTILDVGRMRPSSSRRRHRGRRRGPWSLFSFGRGSRKLRMRSVSPRKKDRYPRADSKDWNPPQPRKRSAQPDDASDRVRGRSHDSVSAHRRLQEHQRERLRAGLEELQADMRLTQATMGLKGGHHCPNDASTAAAMTKFAEQIDRLVDMASGVDGYGPLARDSTTSDGGSGRERWRQWGRGGSIRWDDRTTVSSSSERR